MAQPFWFGEPAYKSTGSCLRALPQLVETNRLTEPKRSTDDWKRWNRIRRMRPGPDRAHLVSPSFPGMMKAAKTLDLPIQSFRSLVLEGIPPEVPQDRNTRTLERGRIPCQYSRANDERLLGLHMATKKFTTAKIIKGRKCQYFCKDGRYVRLPDYPNREE
ncbi:MULTISPECIES: hypothetical protein [Roseobacteraceae]|uniref:hypothetical protein n=1 Tax=Roseobacteraceae TaxID=2854170 RepID=UPI0026858141|nr:hypothetical protein [Phaeobacter gallaeciensis]